jgi:hypothetical protein
MTESVLNYFTHTVDGAVYGAWYRVNSPTQLEVIGIGMLESGEYGGFSPENAAQSILENFVRLRARLGAPIPSLATLQLQQAEDLRAEPADEVSVERADEMDVAEVSVAVPASTDTAEQRARTQLP